MLNSYVNFLLNLYVKKCAHAFFKWPTHLSVRQRCQMHACTYVYEFVWHLCMHICLCAYVLKCLMPAIVSQPIARRNRDSKRKNMAHEISNSLSRANVNLSQATAGVVADGQCMCVVTVIKLEFKAYSCLCKKWTHTNAARIELTVCQWLLWRWKKIKKNKKMFPKIQKTSKTNISHCCC